jgi:hypothetical protein
MTKIGFTATTEEAARQRKVHGNDSTHRTAKIQCTIGEAHGKEAFTVNGITVRPFSRSGTSKLYARVRLRRLKWSKTASDALASTGAQKGNPSEKGVRHVHADAFRAQV